MVIVTKTTIIASMGKRKNKLDPNIFTEARDRVQRSFPYRGLKVGFYSEEPHSTGVFGGIAKVAKVVLMNIRNGVVNLRVYRKPKESGTDVNFKVDEYVAVSEAETLKLKGSKVRDHYIKNEPYDDFMEQNNMTFEVVSDEMGGLKLNTDSQGMVKTYVNFPDPTPETLIEIARQSKPKD